MPVELLADLDAYDLTAVHFTADEVGKRNPQCGAMRQLDHVIVVDRDTDIAIGVKQVRHDEFWVPLHIPGRPLMPGVLMIEAAAQLSSIQYKVLSEDERFLGFTRCDDVVFRGQVVPGDTLILVTERVQFSRRRFICKAQGLVDGNLIFEALITGMAF